MVITFLPINLNNKQRWPHPPKPNLIGYFAGRSGTSEELFFEENALDLLNYYSGHIDRNDLYTFPVAVQSNCLDFSCFPVNLIENWILQHSELEAVKRAKFVANGETLVHILNTPVDPKQEWTFHVKKRNEKYYLFNYSSKLYSRTAQNRCLFHRFNCLPTVFISEAEEFHEVYEIEVGEHRILYAAMLPGVKSDRRVTNLDELKAATHLHTAVCYFGHQLVACRQCTKEWTSATLISADQVLQVTCRCRSTESPFLPHTLQFQVQQTTVDQLIAIQNQIGTSEALNMPYTAWNYLHDLLTLLERQVSRFTVLQDRLFDVKHDSNDLVYMN